MTTNNKAQWNLAQSYMKLPAFFYTNIKPTNVKDPKIVAFNSELACELGLDAEFLRSEAGADVFAGNMIPKGSTPLAQAYAGHQFGHFTRLGDGRAILLGEQVTASGKRYDFQLKGSGRTPYSRGGDGRATLGPMLREYLMSEAMHALGIPTTRGLAVVTTGEQVVRESMLQGAILTRVASSHLRVGTFQYAATWGSLTDLEALANYAIERHHINKTRSENKYVALLEHVINKQAALIAKWQLVGFIHGVMNTDNMTISGETIDYGPCAFMDTYDQKTVFSSIDQEGRYAYGNQAYIGGWNLTRFAEALLPLLHKEEERAVEIAENALATYAKLFQAYFTDGMRAKLGLFNKEETDGELINDLLKLLEKYKADYTNTFVALTFNAMKDSNLHNKEDFKVWYERWEERCKRQSPSKKESRERMRKSNPAIIPRNYYVEEALSAAVEQNNFRLFEELLHALSTPYAHIPDQAVYAVVPTSTTPYKTFCGT